MTQVPLWSLLSSVSERRAQHAAILFGERRILYSELRDRAAALAAALWAWGIRPGDRIALLAANRPEYLELLFASSRIGASLVPLNSRYGSEDLRRALHGSGARLLFTASQFRNQDFERLVHQACGTIPRARGASDAVPDLEEVVTLDQGARIDARRYTDLFALAPQALPAPATFSEQPALVLFTSGTTSAPKGVMLTQSGLLRAMASVRERQRIGAHDVVLSYLPYFHVFGGVIGTLVPLMAGGTILMQPAFEATESLEAAQRHRCTVVYGVGPTWKAWLDHPSFGRYDLSSIRTGVCASGSAAASRIAKRVRGTIAPMHSHFAMTESAGAATMTSRDDPMDIATETAGRPLPGIEVGIFEPESHARLPAEHEGEIRLRGEWLTPGYLNRPDATRLLYTDDRWLRTGDRGWLGSDGCLRVLGRLDDRLRVGGENVMPQEIEAYLATHPAIERAFIVGVPDERVGEIPVAFAIGRAGARLPDDDEVRQFCRGRIADFKIPRRVLYVDEVPGGFHKVQRYRLREEAIRRLALEAEPADTSPLGTRASRA